MNVRLAAVMNMLRRPYLIPSYYKCNSRARHTGNHRQRTAEYEKYKLDLTTALSKVTGAKDDQIGNVLRNFQMVEAEGTSLSEIRFWDAHENFSKICYAIVKIMKPDTVVETGVGRGMSSASILKAMDENGKGQLFSIDLPFIWPASSVGSLVPNHHRRKWTLVLDSGERALPKIMNEKSVDFFVHDSDHSYDSQIAEYTIAWPNISKNGILVSDDVNNDAFLEFTEAIGCEPIIVSQPGKRHPIGLLRKP